MREIINTGESEERSMKGKTVLILLCIAAVCSMPATALEISYGPVLIQETDLPVHSLSTDGRYVVLSGSWENTSLKKYSYKEGFTSDGYIRIYDSVTGKVTDVPGNVPPVFAGKTDIDDGIISWTSAFYRFPVDNGNVRESQAFFRYTIGDSWPKRSHAEPGRITQEDNGRILIVTGSDNHPEETTAIVYDTGDRTTRAVPLSAHPSPSLVWITGEYVIWNELWREGDGKIHLYNLATQETSVIGEDGTYLSVLDAAENVVLYCQSRSRDPAERSSELRAINLVTGETVLITDHGADTAKIDPPVVIWSESKQNGTKYTQSLYAGSLADGKEALLLTETYGRIAVGENLVVWDTWDETTGITRVYAVQLDSPGSTAGVQQPQTLTENPPPGPTQAGMPPQYIIGAAAFALACILAILWRK